MVQRNWELQFLGEVNDRQLKDYIFDESFLEFVGRHAVETVYQQFTQKDTVYYAHPLSMLLTLSLWWKQNM